MTGGSTTAKEQTISIVPTRCARVVLTRHLTGRVNPSNRASGRNAQAAHCAPIAISSCLILATVTALANDNPLELGFMAVLGVEPIYATLSEHKLLPDCQAQGWDEFWNSSELWFSKPDLKTSDKVSTIVASIELFDDGKRVALALACKDEPELLRELVELVRSQLNDYVLTQSEPRPGLQRLDVQHPDASAGEQALAAARAVATRLIERGYVANIPGPPGGEGLLPQQ